METIRINIMMKWLLGLALLVGGLVQGAVVRHTGQVQTADLDGDGAREFQHSTQFLTTGQPGSNAPQWNLFFESHVEWLYATAGSNEVLLLNEGDILGSDTLQGEWGQGSSFLHIISAGASTITSAWSEPFGDRQEATLGMRFLIQDEWHYGFVTFDMYQNEIHTIDGELWAELPDPGWATVRIKEWAWESNSGAEIAVRSIPEPSGVLLVGLGMLNLLRTRKR